MRAWWNRYSGMVAGLLVVLVYVASLRALNLDLAKAIERAPQALRLLRLMGHPEWAYTNELIFRLMETLQIAILGTTIGALLAVPFGFLAARNVVRLRVASGLGKFLLNLIRAFPELILAIMFTKAVGVGAFPGVLAMGMHSIGMLGKLYAEVVEAIDREVLEAMAASGANRVQAVWFGIVPQVLPEFASYAIYRFEINMRAAPILGMVGAGGIGHPLIFAIRDYSWDRVGIILLGIVITVSIVDYLSSWARGKLV